MTKLEFSAGGIVFKRTQNGLRVALILDPYGKWTFAKGHIEEGERPERAALREVMEETGMMGLKIKADLGQMEYWFRAESDLIHKVVYWYLMEAPEDVAIDLQDAEGIAELKWIEINELEKMTGYKDMEKIVKKVMSEFDKINAEKRRT